MIVRWWWLVSSLTNSLHLPWCSEHHCGLTHPIWYWWHQCVLYGWSLVVIPDASLCSPFNAHLYAWCKNYNVVESITFGNCMQIWKVRIPYFWKRWGNFNIWKQNLLYKWLDTSYFNWPLYQQFLSILWNHLILDHSIALYNYFSSYICLPFFLCSSLSSINQNGQ